MHELQAAAAVGQMGLVQMWESCFSEVGLHTAQVLLTHEDLGDRRRYLNARTTLKSLVALGVVPIINENDTVVVDEIRFGDNDTLGALVTNLIEADALAILTDQKGLYSADPRKSPDAQLVSRASAGDASLDAMAGGAGSHLGSGGMLTKVLAAKRAARSGAVSENTVSSKILPSRSRMIDTPSKPMNVRTAMDVPVATAPNENVAGS